MTSNQRLVLRWLRKHCSESGLIRVSNRELEAVFSWSHQYTQKILSSLVSAGYLEERQKGIGRRATKYRVSVAATLSGRSGNHKDVAQHVPSYNPFGTKPFRYITPRNTPRNNNRDNAQTVAHVQNIFDNALRVRKPVDRSSSPFKKFRRHCDNPEDWQSSDFVCYFSFVYKVRYGEYPKLEWPKDIGAARTLLKRIGDPIALKSFIQIAFSQCKRNPPHGLHSFSFGRFYEEIIDREVDESILDEYDDEYVFPWLKEQLLQRSRLAAQEYTRNLVRRGLGIYN
jgi:hypothetical protein